MNPRPPPWQGGALPLSYSRSQNCFNIIVIFLFYVNANFPKPGQPVWNTEFNVKKNWTFLLLKTGARTLYSAFSLFKSGKYTFSTLDRLFYFSNFLFRHVFTLFYDFLLFCYIKRIYIVYLGFYYIISVFIGL